MTKQQDDIRLVLRDVIKQLEADGIRCYWNRSTECQTYVVAGDATGVAYFQYDLTQGWTLCTRHKPCHVAGTGEFVSKEKPTVATVRHAMQRPPTMWKNHIVKYKSVDEYLKKPQGVWLTRVVESHENLVKDNRSTT